MIKVAFLGTPLIGARALESLIDNENIEVVVVVTVLDKAIGRSHSVLQCSPVAKVAREHNIQIIKTNSINEDFEKLKLFKFDYLVTCAFGQILSSDVLNIPMKKSINIHGSLLPEGRGGAPIHWAIINGKKKTGISIMEMVEEMDAGDYYSQYEIDIKNDDNVTSMFKKLGDLIYEKTALGLLEVHDGKKATKQDKEKVSYWPNIQKNDSKIDFNKPAKDVYNLVRGLEEKPGAWTKLNDKIIKIHKVTILKMNDVSNEPGKIIDLNKEGIMVQTKKGIVNITEVTFEGKKRVGAEQLINGNLIIKSDKFN